MAHRVDSGFSVSFGFNLTRVDSVKAPTGSWDIENRNLALSEANVSDIVDALEETGRTDLAAKVRDVLAVDGTE